MAQPVLEKGKELARGHSHVLQTTPLVLGGDPSEGAFEAMPAAFITPPEGAAIISSTDSSRSCPLPPPPLRHRHPRQSVFHSVTRPNFPVAADEANALIGDLSPGTKSEKDDFQECAEEEAGEVPRDDVEVQLDG
ncbi:unnamed protein product [Vitrella brassicaformis CCMP3155]|uniref:Uncharacterized protein n=1 Tax=Vitrella brassicaformis (strain CCMP3155) TaxID=1169540 RepID=A0A0G4EJ27_VITBC|nr:unnamed protein product [Vitrella brassicaformis CCMP3155]|eukprot:CEL96707.1 unnamed protein product [Vitrella brassicaformis CCMP3155]